MNAQIKSMALMLVIFSIILFGVHKNDANTQDQIKAQAHHSAQLAWTICETRNASVTKSNARWQNEKAAWTVAAQARIAQAEAESDPTLKAEYLDAAKTYQAVADAIVPYIQVPCGPKP